MVTGKYDCELNHSNGLKRARSYLALRAYLMIFLHYY